MISTSASNLLPMVFAIALMVLLGVIGLARGVRREAVVSGAIVLGALIVEQWGTPWADDLYALYTGVSRGWQQLVLSYALMILVVLVVGYGLGKLALTLPIGRSSRTWGLLLGLANGSALAGWLLRYIYSNLDGSQATSPLYQDAVSYGFMIWAGWFPVALAAIGAVVALLSPLRSAQTVVAQPSPATNWTPIDATTTTTSTTASTTLNPGIYPAPVSPIPSSLAPIQPYNAQSYGAPAPSYSPSPLPPPMPAASNSPYRAEPEPEHDAPSTQLFPIGEASPSAINSNTGDTQGNATRSFVPPTPSNTPQAPEATNSGTVSSPGAQSTSEWLPGVAPSWLMGNSGGASGSSETAYSPVGASTNSTLNNPTEAGLDSNNASRSTPITGPLSEEALASKTCRACGAKMPANARFCTDCGTPVTQA